MQTKPESTKHQGIPFNFDGRTLIIPPLSLGAMEQLQGRLETMGEHITKPEYIATVVDSVHAALQRNYPDMTREEVAGLLDLQNMQEVMACVFDVGGVKRKALETSTGGADV